MRSGAIFVAAVGIGAALLGASAAVARRVVLGGRTHYIAARPGAEPSSVLLSESWLTVLPGIYALEFQDGERVIVGGVLGARRGGPVERTVLGGRVPTGGGAARFMGAVLTPADLAAEPSLTASGSWQFGAADGGSTWAVHVHGMGASPESTLRSVSTMESLGIPSIIVSFGTPFHERRSGVAADDIQRVVAAIDEAVSIGANRVVLCGWSYGAVLCVAAARLRSRVVVGAILVSPMVDFARAVRSGAQAARIPRLLVESAIALLAMGLGGRLVGVRGAIPIRRLSQHPPRDLPILALHSEGDRTLQISATREFSRRLPHFTLVETSPAPHTLEWNRDRAAFDQAVASFIQDLRRRYE